jgi:hypothetical protein
MSKRPASPNNDEPVAKAAHTASSSSAAAAAAVVTSLDAGEQTGGGSQPLIFEPAAAVDVFLRTEEGWEVHCHKYTIHLYGLTMLMTALEAEPSGKVPIPAGTFLSAQEMFAFFKELLHWNNAAQLQPGKARMRHVHLCNYFGAKKECDMEVQRLLTSVFTELSGEDYFDLGRTYHRDAFFPKAMRAWNLNNQPIPAYAMQALVPYVWGESQRVRCTLELVRQISTEYLASCTKAVTCGPYCQRRPCAKKPGKHGHPAHTHIGARNRDYSKNQHDTLMEIQRTLAS